MSVKGLYRDNKNRVSSCKQESFIYSLLSYQFDLTKMFLRYFYVLYDIYLTWCVMIKQSICGANDQLIWLVHTYLNIQLTHFEH